MRRVVYFFLLLCTFLGGFTCASEVKEEETDPSDFLESQAIATPHSTMHHATASDSASEGTTDTEATHSSGQADETYATSAVLTASPSISMTGAESSRRPPASMTEVPENEASTGAESSGSLSKFVTEAPKEASTNSDDSHSSFLPPSTTTSSPTGIELRMDAESHLSPRGSLVSTASEASGSLVSSLSEASGRASMALGSDDESSLSSADPASDARTSLTLSWGEEEKKGDEELMSIMSFLLEGVEDSDQEDSASAESAAQPECCGGMKAKGGEDDLRAAKASRRNAFLKRMKRTFKTSTKKCMWDVSLKLEDRRQALSQLCKTPSELRRMLRAPTMSLRKTKLPPPFEGQRSPDMLMLAAFLKSAAVHSATGRLSSSLSSVEGYTRPFRSGTQGTTLPLVITQTASLDPLTYDVIVDGAEHTLVSVPLHEDFEKLKSAIIVELMRVRSFLRAAHIFRISSGKELLEGYRWSLFLDLLVIPKEKKYPIEFPDGMKVANYFVLKKKMETTLKDFVRLALHLETSEAEVVYVARASVSAQLLRLMSIYARMGLVFPTLSVEDFEISQEGVLYMNTVSPWYSAGKFYEVVDVHRGFYLRIDEDKKAKAEAQVVYLGEESYSSNLVHILLAIWCGDEGKSSAVEEPDHEERRRIANALLHARQREAKCLPESVFLFLSKWLLPENESRLRLSEAMETPEWEVVQGSLEQAMQFYDITKTE